MNTNQKGTIAETAVAAAAALRGYMVSFPAGHCSYDLVVDRSGKLNRVQVKHLTANKGAVLVKFTDLSSKTNRVNYSAENIDALVVYESLSRKILWIPVEDGSNMAGLTIRFAEPKNGQKIGIRLASDYEAW